jgi:hypothetical protein
METVTLAVKYSSDIAYTVALFFTRIKLLCVILFSFVVVVVVVVFYEVSFDNKTFMFPVQIFRQFQMSFPVR